MDKAGNILVADSGNNRIRSISVHGLLLLQEHSDFLGVVTTIAGTGNAGNVDGPSNQAEFNMPAGLAIDSVGNVVIADKSNNCIRLMTSQGV